MATAGVEKPTWRQPKQNAELGSGPLLHKIDGVIWKYVSVAQTAFSGDLSRQSGDCGQRGSETKLMQITVKNAEYWPRLSVRLLIA